MFYGFELQGYINPVQIKVTWPRNSYNLYRAIILIPGLYETDYEKEEEDYNNGNNVTKMRHIATQSRQSKVPHGTHGVNIIHNMYIL